MRQFSHSEIFWHAGNDGVGFFNGFITFDFNGKLVIPRRQPEEGETFIVAIVITQNKALPLDNLPLHGFRCPLNPVAVQLNRSDVNIFIRRSIGIIRFADILFFRLQSSGDTPVNLSVGRKDKIQFLGSIVLDGDANIFLFRLESIRVIVSCQMSKLDSVWYLLSIKLRTV